MSGSADSPVATLRRWEDAGGVWRVVGRGGGQVTIGLYQCTGGEEVDRITSDHPDLLRLAADRAGSEE